MQIFIKDIVNTPELRTRLVCGEKGLCKVVKWAHVCEMKDPTEWFGEHDLLMTTGLAIPSDLGEQKEYILRLIKANIAGLMIGENMNAPDDISALCSIAAEFDFPILITHYGVPFAAVTKMITNSRYKLEFEKNRIIATLYENARSELNTFETKEIINRINSVLDVKIYLVNIKTSSSLFDEDEILSHEILDKLEELVNKKFSSLSLVKKINISEKEYLYLLDTTFYDYKLLIIGSDLDYSIIHHVLSIISMNLERRKFDYQRKLRVGSELIDDVIYQRVNSHQLDKKLVQYDIDIYKAHVVVCKLKSNINYEEFLFLKKLKIILKKQPEEYICIVNNEDLEVVREMIDQGGISNPIEYLERIPTAIQEARLALKHSDYNENFQIYSKINNILPWLPSDIEEAKRIFDRYLGQLERQDVLQNTFYIQTLKTFLENNCSWDKTSKSLNIHKQTLVYRIQKIQKIIGRNLNNTEDISILWFALKCEDVFKV